MMMAWSGPPQHGIYFISAVALLVGILSTGIEEEKGPNSIYLLLYQVSPRGALNVRTVALWTLWWTEEVERAEILEVQYGD